MEQIVLYGKILFEPKNMTKKHESQASWKHIAMVMFNDDVANYYAWFLKKRYSLILNPPMRGGHISFINDKFSDMSKDGLFTKEEILKNWDAVRDKYDKMDVEVSLYLEPRTNSKHWWLRVTPESSNDLQVIRNEANLGKPNFSFHMSIGYANDKNIAHSGYIHTLIKNGLANN